MEVVSTPKDDKVSALGKVTSVPKADKDSKDYKRIKLGIFLSGLCVFAQLYLFQPLLPALCRQFEITPEHSSLAVSAGTIGMAIGLFIFAFRADGLPRKKLMMGSIFGASILTLLSAFMPSFEWLILINFLKGLVLSGVTAVALAYLSEEVNIGILGAAIGLYLSGNTIGGMSGRVLSILLSGTFDWRIAVMSIAIGCIALGIAFYKIFPASKHFIPQKVSFKEKKMLMLNFLKNRYLLALFIIGGAVMGSFVSIYNYLGFRLEAKPFELPHYLIASVFLMYTIGVWGSMKAGKWSDKYASKNILWKMVVMHLIGLLLLFSTNIFVLVIGLGAVTFSFFAAHTLASRMVSQSTVVGKSSATCLYWLFYYIGSSLVGSSTGWVLSNYKWEGLLMILITIVVITLLISVWIKGYQLNKSNAPTNN